MDAVSVSLFSFLPICATEMSQSLILLFPPRGRYCFRSGFSFFPHHPGIGVFFLLEGERSNDILSPLHEHGIIRLPPYISLLRKRGPQRGPRLSS